MGTRQIRGGALSAVGLVCALAVSASLVRAQSALPTGWASREIGSTGIDGSTTFSSGTWTITGGGANIWGTSDEFRFAYQQITGDVDIRVRLATFEDLEQYSKAGVMIRETLYANSRNAFMLFRADRALFLQSRPYPGASTDREDFLRWGRSGLVAAGPTRQPIHRLFFLERDVLDASGYGDDQHGRRSVCRAGGHQPHGLSSLDGKVHQSPGQRWSEPPRRFPRRGPAATLAAPRFVGRHRRRVELLPWLPAVSTSGGRSDQFHFVYQPLQGDVEVIARIASLQAADGWSKAGVMIRESLTANSRNAFMKVSGSQGWGFQQRIATGDESYNQDGPNGTAPGWARLVREGNLFSAYRSTDGTTWSLVGSDTISMASTVYVGVALTSHDTAQRATATFTNLTARKLTTGTNRPPTVSITRPSAGATFTAPASMTVTATASDTDGTISRVDFYRGSTLLSSDTSRNSQNEYSYNWMDVGAGSYQLKAVATDNDGETTSSSVTVTVNSPTNQAPTVSLTRPAPSSTFTAPASITLAARASDTDGTIAKVDFYRGSTLLGSDTTRNSQNEYTYSWTNVAAGSYQLNAVARDNDGATATSLVANITVTTLAAPTPTRVAFNASADHATNVTSYTVALYRGADNPATASPVGTNSIGKPTPVSGVITVDISTLVNPLPVGTYKAVVRALGPGGTTASAPSPTFTK